MSGLISFVHSLIFSAIIADPVLQKLLVHTATRELMNIFSNTVAQNGSPHCLRVINVLNTQPIL